jgi:hypothetical protein
VKVLSGGLPKLSARTSVRILLVLAILLPLVPLRGLIAPADHAGYLKLIDEADLGHTTGLSSKQYVGLFYSFVERIVPYWVFTNAVLITYLYFATLAIRTLSAYMIAVVVTLPMFIQFNYVSKEAILGLVGVLGVSVTLVFGKRAGRVAFVAGLLLFAVFVRPYYAIPIAGTAVVAIFGLRRGLWLALGVFAFILFFYTQPLEAIEANRQRMYIASVGSFGTRTVYPNVSLGGDALFQVDVIRNYLIVLGETLFPVSWTQALKDLYAQVFMICITMLVVGSLKTGDRLVAIFGVFLMLTVPFFSPDLGTSLRHIAAAAFLLHLGIALQRIYDGGSLTFRPQQLLPIYPSEGSRVKV